jgi:hypothetical protein
MQNLTSDFREVPGVAEDWEDCWENILRLPIEPLSNRHLYQEAERLVRACRSRAGDEGIERLKWQVSDGLLFVAEELANDPNDPEWQRIDAVLAGAQAGITGDL